MNIQKSNLSSQTPIVLFIIIIIIVWVLLAALENFRKPFYGFLLLLLLF